MTPDADALKRISDGIFVLDRDWRFIYLNASGARLVERTLESLIGRVIWDEFPEAVGTVFEDEYRRAMDLQEPTEFEVYYEPLSRWYSVRAQPSAESLTVIYQDATQRRAADDAIASLLEQLQRQRRLATVLAETNEVVFRAESVDELFHSAVSIAVEHGGFVGAWIGVVDVTTGQLVDVAHAGEGMDEYLRDVYVTSRDEPHGRGTGGRAVRLGHDQFSNDIYSDPNMAPWRDAATRVGYRSSGALPLVCNGEVHGLLSVYAREPSYFNEDERTLIHRLAANVAYGWDALVREEALRESDVARRTAQRFQAVLSSAPDAIIGLNAAGRIEMANDRVQELFAWSADEVLGRPIEQLISFESPDDPATPWFDRLCLVESPTNSGAFTGWRRDGSAFPAEVALASFDDNGEATFIVAVQDLTERLELEAQRRRLALEAEREQQDRLDSLGRLAGGVAHDFNNLLSVILNYLTLMERQQLSDHTRNDLGQVRAAAERGVALTRQLLTFARRDPGGAETTDAIAALRSIASLLEVTMGTTVSLRLELASEALSVSIGPEQFDQVIVNLAINARDAMPDGGELTIAVTSRPDPLFPVVVRVRDTGVGMEPEVVSRAFEPFFTTKPRGQGTGLGLATVYGIVSRAGGRVVIDSHPGAGTTFEIHLVAAREPVPSESATPAPPHGVVARGGRLLLVEDDPALRVATQRILSDAGYEVRVAVDGREALDVLAELDYDLDAVVSDVVMPGLTGLELANHLNLHAPHLPILLLSGYDSAPAPVEHPVLIKPVDRDTLLRSLEGIIRAD